MSSAVLLNLQNDAYQNTKQVLKAVQEHTDRLTNQLISQGFIISFLHNHSLKALNSLWSSTQSKLPKKYFNFTIRYLNNTLATHNNLQKQNLSQSSDCSFCLASSTLYINELTVGFETNIDRNANRKYEKYRSLKQEVSSNYHEVKFINISISLLGIFGNSCDAYIQLYNDLDCDKKHLKYILKKLITVIICITYYIFCMRNKPWTNPKLLTY